MGITDSSRFEDCTLRTMNNNFATVQSSSSNADLLAFFSVLCRVTCRKVYLHHSVAQLPSALPINSFPKY